MDRPSRTRPPATWAEFLSRIGTLPGRSRRRALADVFLEAACRRGLPLVEGNTAVFLYRGVARSVHLTGDMNGWLRPGTPLARLPGTDLWYHSQAFEPDARLDYKFLLDGRKWLLDPENPRHCPGGKGPNSELAMPGYTEPEELRPWHGMPRGWVETVHLPSRRTGAVHPVHVYLPHEYHAGRRHFPTVYFQDGGDYLTFAHAAEALDALIASGRIRPLVAVFIRPTDRAAEYVYARRDDYRRFFVRSVVPWVDRTFRTIPSPDARLVIGDSFGANIAAAIAWRHPRTFGLTGWQSPAFWPNRWETLRMLMDGPRRAMRIFAVWGTYELLDATWRSRLEALAQTLPAKGYDIRILTRPEGHSWGLWRATLAPLLIHFFPPK